MSGERVVSAIEVVMADVKREVKRSGTTVMPNPPVPTLLGPVSDGRCRTLAPHLGNERTRCVPWVMPRRYEEITPRVVLEAFHGTREVAFAPLGARVGPQRPGTTVASGSAIPRAVWRKRACSTAGAPWERRTIVDKGRVSRVKASPQRRMNPESRSVRPPPPSLR